MNNAPVSFEPSLFDQANVSSDGLTAWRKQAQTAFQRQGLPTHKDEAWKYVRLTALREQSFDLMTTESLAKARIAPWLLAGCYHLVVVNGFVAMDLSHLPTQTGFDVYRVGQHSDRVQTWIEQSELSDSFVALNTALFQDGIGVQLGDHCRLDQPLQCLFVTTTQVAATSQQRHIIQIGAGASLELIADHVSLTDTPVFTNAVWHMDLAEEAKLHYSQVFDNHAAALHFDYCLLNQQRDSHFEGLSFIKGGQLLRTEVKQRFHGENASCKVRGLSTAQDQQQVSQLVEIHHAEAHCHSEQFFKGIARDRSRLIMNGKAIVAKGAQKTDAQQHYKNLLLNRQAEIYTRPELEIYANDVKCAHGASVGQLSEEALFYLQSRGVSDAEHVLIAAFGQELLAEVQVPALRARLDALFAANGD